MDACECGYGCPKGHGCRGGNELEYYILCKKRSSDGLALWWRPDRCGYTTDLDRAGKYPKEDADDIAGIRGEDYPVPVDAIGDILATRTVVSVEDDHNFQVLRSFMGVREPMEEVKP